MKSALPNFYSLSFLFLSLFYSSSYAQEIGQIKWLSCPYIDCSDINEKHRIRFGKITVPENYTIAEKNKLQQIAFAVIKARRQPSKTDPVLILAGGWGSSILKHINYFSEHFLGDERDLILYDYRGTGLSSPAICPDIGEKVYRQLVSSAPYNEFESWQSKIFENCLDTLESQGIDWNQYGTDNRSKDANLLAKQLNYEYYTVFGTSGGTRTIQSFIRNATVEIRCVILDSSVPIGYPIIFDGISNYSKSLRRILDHCRRDSLCNESYPNLENRFLDFLSELDKNPLVIKLKAGPKVYLNRQEVNAIVYNQLYDESNFESLPFFLETLVNRKKFILRRILRVRQIESMVLESINGAGFLNYMADYKVFQSDYLSNKTLEKESLIFELLDSYSSYFPNDNRFAIKDFERIPVESDIPTLFVVGSYDPTTPPKYTRFMKPNFSNSYVLEFPKVGHGLFNNECAQESILQFIENTGDKPLVSCLEEYKSWKLSFFVRGKK